MIKNIIEENGKVKHENSTSILEELELKETNDFKEFKSLIEKQVKMFLFNKVKEILQKWKIKNFKKIYVFKEKGIKYNPQNFPNKVFQTHYDAYQKASEYFNNDYNTLIISDILEKLKEIIYIKINKNDDAFTDNCYLLELLPEFQESTSKNSMNDMQNRKRNINQLAKENQQENEEWDITKDNEIKELKNNNTDRKIALYEQLNKNIKEKKET